MAADRAPLHVIGAGGHARVLADCARRAGFTVAAFVDRAEPGGADRAPDGTPILEEEAFLARIESGSGPIQIALGLGENGQRHRLAGVYERAGKGRLAFPAIVDPTAVVGHGVVVEPGAVVMAHAVLNAGARVGKFSVVNTGAIVEHDGIIGPYAAVAPGACLGGGVRLGEGAFVGLGANVIQGVTVGAHAVLGAGAVAIRDIAAEVVAIGVPARVCRAHAPWAPVLSRARGDGG